MAKKNCKNCRGGPETFWYMRRRYVYDVDMARRFTSDGRETVELEPDDVRSSVEESDINEEHIDHVDPTFPGIVAHVLYQDPDGELLRGHVLIDGHHRAARCLRDGLPFEVYILSEVESIAAMQTCPDNLPHMADLQSREAELVA